MKLLKDQGKLDYVPNLAGFKPGPKNGHFSQVDPGYAEISTPYEEALKSVWATNNSVDQLRQIFVRVPGEPDGCPKEGTDVDISQDTLRVRDGSELPFRMYRSKQQSGDAMLILKFHGGGWTVGTVDLEETENLYCAALPNTVMVSVDYRMWVPPVLAGSVVSYNTRDLTDDAGSKGPRTSISHTIL
jgi:hypothetical protein